MSEKGEIFDKRESGGLIKLIPQSEFDNLLNDKKIRKLVWDKPMVPEIDYPETIYLDEKGNYFTVGKPNTDAPQNADPDTTLTIETISSEVIDRLLK